MELPRQWIAEHTAWLSTRLFETPVFSVDLWSCIHCAFGFILFAILARLGTRFIYWKLFGLLLVCQILAAGFMSVLDQHLWPETFTARFSDLVVGLAGGLGAALLLKWWDRLSMDVGGNARLCYWITAGIASPAVAFLWVGSYGYQYNVAALSNRGISWFGWGLWTFGHLVILGINSGLKSRVSTARVRLSILWAIYFLVLLVIEFVGYYLLGIHEVGHPACPALILGLIHGTPVLFGFYLTAPFWSLAAQNSLLSLFHGKSRVQGEDLLLIPAPSCVPAENP
jgi:hypothetical protein